jgi:hypothetical protein
MSDPKFLSPQELSDRWGGRISVRTLANWRTQGSGPAFTKIGGAVLYPYEKLAAWEERSTVNSTSQYGSIGA